MDILIVEDDQDNLDVLREYLCTELGGQLCDSATSVPEAMEMVRKNHYDLILLDLMIHGRHSTPFAQFVRETWPLNPPAICLMSASRIVDKIAGEIHADNYLFKPYDLEILDNYLKRKQANLENSFRH